MTLNELERWVVRAGLSAALCVPVVVAASLCSASAAETTTFIYDELGRLVSTSNVGGPRNGKGSGLNYDPMGNRTAAAVAQPMPPPIPNASTFSVSVSPSVNEGGVATFAITRSGTAASSMTLNFATVGISAFSPSDFQAASGTMTFLPWETVRTVDVAVLDDGLAEGAEQFSLVLSAPSVGGSIGTGTATTAIGGSGPANSPPVAVDDNGSMGVCSNKNFDVIANDSDPEGNTPLTLISVTHSGGMGVASVFNSTTVRFQAFGGTGLASVTYTVQDSLGATSTGTLSISIQDLGGCN